MYIMILCIQERYTRWNYNKKPRRI